MALTIHTDPIPLRLDEHGVIRVGDSQVLLDIVIQQFNNGAEPEAIAHGFPTLNLAKDAIGAGRRLLSHHAPEMCSSEDWCRGRPQGHGDFPVSRMQERNVMSERFNEGSINGSTEPRALIPLLGPRAVPITYWPRNVGELARWPQVIIDSGL